MKRLVLIALLSLTTAAVACSVAKALQNAEYGVIAACAIGQDTLSAEACADLKDGLEASIALSKKDGAAANPKIHAILSRVIAKWPADQGGWWIDYLLPKFQG